MKTISFLSFLMIRVCMLATALCACTAAAPPADSVPRLAALYHGRVKIGAAIEPATLERNEVNLLASQFDSVVAENVMKPSRIQPGEGEFRFDRADAIVNFARAHDMAVRGHTLLWYLRTPDWFWEDKNGLPASRDLVLARLKRHIEAVVGRYKADVYAWDVVNEVIDASQPNCLRNDKWFQVVGPDYVDLAFRYAHAVDPQARLFINDYSTTQPDKLQCLERFVKGMLARGVPVHGVGHQMHVSLFEPSAAQVNEALSVFARLGLENQITEMDMTLYRRHAYLLSDDPEKLVLEQGKRYKELMSVFLRHPEVTSVTWWGVSDAHTSRNAYWDWWRSDQPLLFDRQQRPKPGFWGIVEAAHSLPPTHPDQR
jgi:endo-1,4-beta-xylanase